MANESRPNVLVIVSDDQGCWALGCAGNPEIRTPNLDRLAAAGIRFQNCFCASPVCSPARATLLTGRIPSQHGVHDWIRVGNRKEEGAIEYLAGQTAYSELLADAGYQCAFSGKWHLGDSARPQKGFTRWYCHAEGGGPYYGAPVYVDGELRHEPDYITDRITDEALRYLDEMQQDAAPWLLSVNYTAPHSPWVDSHPEELVASYAHCPFDSCPQEPPHPWLLENTVPAGCHSNPRPHLQGYFAAVTAMDASIGRIFDWLEARGQWENSMIFFTSDNGYNCGHHGIWGKGNGTLPLNMYDTSVKVPTILAHPGHIGGGQICDALLSHYDFMPTLLDYLGIAQPDADALPGRSFAGLLRGEACDGRENVVVYDEYGPVRMIRSQDWKYVHRYPYGPHELYHLAEAPGERRNLADAPEAARVLKELRAQLEEWFLRYVEPRRDGVREPVRGKGQIRLCGPASRGEDVFMADTGRETDPSGCV